MVLHRETCYRLFLSLLFEMQGHTGNGSTPTQCHTFGENMSWIDALAGLLVGFGLATVSYVFHWTRYEKWKTEKRREIRTVFPPRTALEKLEPDLEDGERTFPTPSEILHEIVRRRDSEDTEHR